MILQYTSLPETERDESKVLPAHSLLIARSFLAHCPLIVCSLPAHCPLIACSLPAHFPLIANLIVNSVVCPIKSNCNRRHPSRVCNDFEKFGSCHRGDLCRFCHPLEYSNDKGNGQISDVLGKGNTEQFQKCW